MVFLEQDGALIARRGGETLRIEGWGKDALRVRAVMDDGWRNDWLVAPRLPRRQALAARHTGSLRRIRAGLALLAARKRRLDSR